MALHQNYSILFIVLSFLEKNQQAWSWLTDHFWQHDEARCTFASKLWEWRQLGSNVSLLDLRKAYQQVRVSETMWPFQTVVFAGRRYCLTRLGFGLNVAKHFYWLAELRNNAIRMSRACFSILLAAVEFPLLPIIVLLPKYCTAHYTHIFV